MGKFQRHASCWGKIRAAENFGLSWSLSGELRTGVLLVRRQFGRDLPLRRQQFEGQPPLVARSGKTGSGRLLTSTGLRHAVGDGVPIVHGFDADGAPLFNYCEFQPDNGRMWGSLPADGFLVRVDSCRS